MVGSPWMICPRKWIILVNCPGSLAHPTCGHGVSVLDTMQRGILEKISGSFEKRGRNARLQKSTVVCSSEDSLLFVS